MDEFYDEIFGPAFGTQGPVDEEDLYFHKYVPTMDVTELMKILEKDLEIINSSHVDATDWVRFKYCLLKYEQLWETKIFKWTPQIDSPLPYIGIDILWEHLENKPTRYFQVHMAFEDCWFGERLANVWEIMKEGQTLI